MIAKVTKELSRGVVLEDQVATVLWRKRISAAMQATLAWQPSHLGSSR